MRRDRKSRGKVGMKCRHVIGFEQYWLVRKKQDTMDLQVRVVARSVGFPVPKSPYPVHTRTPNFAPVTSARPLPCLIARYRRSPPHPLVCFLLIFLPPPEAAEPSHRLAFAIVLPSLWSASPLKPAPGVGNPRLFRTWLAKIPFEPSMCCMRKYTRLGLIEVVMFPEHPMATNRLLVHMNQSSCE